MPRYRGNVGNLLQHWVLCELLAESNRHFDQIRFADAYAMAPCATERFEPGWSAHLFDHVRDRASDATPYERTWKQAGASRSAYPNSAVLLTAMWRGRYSLLLCESDPATVDELQQWAPVQRQSPDCIDVKIAPGDWRKRFESPASKSDGLTYLSFDPDMFDRHGSREPRIMDPADLDIVAAAVEPIRGTVLLQLSTYSANHANGQEAVSAAVASGLGSVGLTLLARVRTDGQMMSLVLGRAAGTLADITSLPGRFDSWLRSVKAYTSSRAKAPDDRWPSVETGEPQLEGIVEHEAESMNFKFLADHEDRRLLELVSKSEGSFWRDPAAAVMHAGRLAERMVVYALKTRKSIGAAS